MDLPLTLIQSKEMYTSREKILIFFLTFILFLLKKIYRSINRYHSFNTCFNFAQTQIEISEYKELFFPTHSISTRFCRIIIFSFFPSSMFDRNTPTTITRITRRIIHVRNNVKRKRLLHEFRKSNGRIKRRIKNKKMERGKGVKRRRRREYSRGALSRHLAARRESREGVPGGFQRAKPLISIIITSPYVFEPVFTMPCRAVDAYWCRVYIRRREQGVR